LKKQFQNYDSVQLKLKKTASRLKKRDDDYNSLVKSTKTKEILFFAHQQKIKDMNLEVKELQTQLDETTLSKTINMDLESKDEANKKFTEVSHDVNEESFDNGNSSQPKTSSTTSTSVTSNETKFKVNIHDKNEQFNENLIKCQQDARNQNESQSSGSICREPVDVSSQNTEMVLDDQIEVLRSKVNDFTGQLHISSGKAYALELLYSKSRNEISILKSLIMLKDSGMEFDSARIIAKWQYKYEATEKKLQEVNLHFNMNNNAMQDNHLSNNQNYTLKIWSKSKMTEKEALGAKLTHLTNQLKICNKKVNDITALLVKSKKEINSINSYMTLKGMDKEFKCGNIIATWQYKFQIAEHKLKDLEKKQENDNQTAENEHYERQLLLLKQNISSLKNELVEVHNTSRLRLKNAYETSVNTIGNIDSKQDFERFCLESSSIFGDLMGIAEEVFNTEPKASKSSPSSHFDVDHEKSKEKFEVVKRLLEMFKIEAIHSKQGFPQISRANENDEKLADYNYIVLEENIKLQRIIINLQNSLNLMKQK
jgi:hypothetical protein